MQRLQPLADLIDRLFVGRPLLVIALYFAFQVVLRVALPMAPGDDDAGELVTTQLLALGYGPQPPLYTWLTWGFFKIFGQTIFALALLKNICLFITYAFVWRIARIAGASPRAAAVAMFGLLLLPQIAWESQRALSHTVLAVALTAVTLERMLMLVRDRRAVDYLLLGLAIGLGCLSKYNFFLLPLTLGLAMLATPEGRAALLHPWILETLAIAAALVLPHAIWAAFHLDAVTANVGKFRIEATGLAARAKGIALLVGASIAFLALAAVVFTAVFARFRTGTVAGPAADAPPFEPLARRWLHLALLGAFAVVVVLIVATGATNVKDRWLQPLLFLAPLLTALWLEVRVPPEAMRWPLVAAAAAMLSVAVALPLNARIEATGHAAWSAAGTALRAASPEAATVVSLSHTMAGSLRYTLGNVVVLDPEMPLLPIRTSLPALVVWPSVSGDDVPGRLKDLVALRLGRGVYGPVSRFETPAWAWSGRKLSMSYAVYRAETP